MADTETEALSHALAQSRARLSHHATVLADRANVARRLKRSVKRKPVPWIAAAVVLGLLIAARRPKPRRVEVHTVQASNGKNSGKLAFVLAAGKIALDAFRPAITSWIGQRISQPR